MEFPQQPDDWKVLTTRYSCGLNSWHRSEATVASKTIAVWFLEEVRSWS